MVNKEYKSASEAVSEILGDEEFTKELKDQMRRRRVVKTLTSIRAASGVTQEEVAAILGCKQPTISKIEKGVDSDLKMAEIEAYAKATHSEITILVSDRGMSLADQIKYHAFSIRQAFLKLSELAHQDEVIAKGVAELHVQAFHNINSFLAESASKLPACPDNGMPYVRMIAKSSKKKSSDDSSDEGLVSEDELAMS